MELRGKLLDVSGLKVSFYTYRGVIKALDGVELWMDSGERLGVVGETGCGKSVTSLAVMRLIEQPGEIQAGKVIFNGKSLLELSEENMNRVRGIEMSMIFQEPRSSLNPVMKVGYQIGEAIAKSKKMPIKKTYPEVREMLKLVGLDPDRVMNSYPHELSGGMSQRVMIGMGLATHPKLLIADEPTSALDVTIQAQILELLDELARKMGNAVMLITHDMGVVAEFCDKVMVMYAGNSVEYASTVELFERPLHPYTGGLLLAVPRVGRTDELKAIKGTVPDLVDPPSGCRFHPRCPRVMEICKENRPPLVQVEPGHFVACYLYGNEGEVKENA
ncbi:MAG TPA: ABC transporter ATP-binding protein [Mesotoga sp.]|jgi:peptide/nickel transport system ATP-binding protein|nr:ABC transporter ATP-binding protein [Mesotoga sp.]MDI9376161.1 ABC transporter ATP-binding protein [Thermotogota bacterium]NLX32850.1 ABC transporter ATP-binding protein [Thermotogaceae bacterium]MDD4041670.1 ABC transporter ATP-binding protein [Mesotoga sp.]MDD4478253.1 ABC transporter ATP-binding protein [Mesotoga sp.]